MAAEHNITAYNNETFELFLTVKDDIDAAVDNTGYTAMMEIRKNNNSPGYEKRITTDANDGITLGGSDGKITLYISLDDMKKINVGTNVYDFLWTNTDDKTERLFYGTFIVLAGVTHPD